jgi:dolichyl-phosphate beta-glucosyltransferase
LDAAPNTEPGTPAASDAAVDLSIVIPVFNEEHRILESLVTLESFLLANDIDAEVILVDDGSTDNTRCVISNFAIAHPAFRAVGVPHAGKASAVLAGLETARGAIVGFIDADMATPLETWFACRKAIEGGAGIAAPCSCPAFTTRNAASSSSAARRSTKFCRVVASIEMRAP